MVNLLICILSGASGGAGALVTTPLMVLLGLSPAQAIASAKFTGLGVSLGASSRFFREKLTDIRTVIIFSAIGGAAAIVGSLTLVQFSDNSEGLQKLMGLVIIVVGVPMLYFRNAGTEKKIRSLRLKIVGSALLAVGVFLQVALGSGIGSLQMTVLISCFGMTALVASATRRAMQLTVASVSLVVFIAAGLIDYRYGLTGLATGLVGGYIGAHIAVKKGNKFIINLFAA